MAKELEDRAACIIILILDAFYYGKIGYATIIC